MRSLLKITCTALILMTGLTGIQAQDFPVPDTQQFLFFDSTTIVSPVTVGEPFYGQDANYQGTTPQFTDHGDGTVTDEVTHLMWQQSPDMNGDGVINYDDKMSYKEALAYATGFDLAGYTDWRLPTIKEMYSLMDFRGIDPSGYTGTSTAGLTPFIDTLVFAFGYGDQSAGERIIDAQLASSTLYVGLTMHGDTTMFGVNFADGRIKGYGIGPLPGQTVDKQFYVMYVRGDAGYGVNVLTDNGDGTVTDQHTGLMWSQDDSGEGMKWEEALAYAEGSGLAGYSDWRLPNVKELQGLVDYTRAPAVTNSAAIDPVFNCTPIIDEGGLTNYPFYWSGTTHQSFMPDTPGMFASYVCFGEALGWMEEPPGSGNYTLMDVHGAGAQRSDPKYGDPADYPHGNGPQGDVVRIYNYVRLVRNATVSIIENSTDGPSLKVWPNPVTDNLRVSWNEDQQQVLEWQLCTMDGRTVGSGIISNEQRIDISQLKAGTYVLKVNHPDQQLHQLIIKQ